MNEHTPGPWKATFEDSAGYDAMSSGWLIESASQQTITVVDCGGYEDVGHEWCSPSPTAEANARLIAAAPDLLEAVKSLQWSYQSDGPHD